MLHVHYYATALRLHLDNIRAAIAHGDEEQELLEYQSFMKLINYAWKQGLRIEHGRVNGVDYWTFVRNGMVPSSAFIQEEKL